MSPGKQRLLEDRAMRDAAKAVVTNDITYLKSEAGRKSLAERALDGGIDYARNVADGAIDLVDRNKVSLSGGIGLAAAAVLGWIFRAEIAQAVSGVVEGLLSGDDDTTSDEPASEEAELTPAEPANN